MGGYSVCGNRTWRQTHRNLYGTGKVMASVFGAKCGIIRVDFLPHCAIINSKYYCRVLSAVHMNLREKNPAYLFTNGVCFSRTTHELTLLTAPCANYSYLARRYYHTLLTAKTWFHLILTYLHT